MHLQTHRYIRGIVLGLMFFLAGTAFCSSDSYDPNPYDDIPPVVTVEYNYVVPSLMSGRLAGMYHCERLSPACDGFQAQFMPTALEPFHIERTASVSLHHLDQQAIPLRR
jgi:hypothetical protein